MQNFFESMEVACSVGVKPLELFRIHRVFAPMVFPESSVECALHEGTPVLLSKNSSKKPVAVTPYIFD